MIPDFELIVHKFPERQDITIIPIADVHLGAAECMEQEFRSFIGTIAEKPNVYVVLGGDLVSNGLKNSLTNVYEEVYRPSMQKRLMAEILAPIRDRILCAVSGNHERRSARDCDDDVTRDILCKIDREEVYRENMAFVKLQFGEQNGNGAKNPTYTMVVTHGNGGGQLTSGAVLRGERSAYCIDGADAFIFGHHHKPFVTQPGKIVIDKQNNMVSVKPFKVIGMTSWLDYAGYAMQKMLLPTTHCLHTLTLCGDHKEMIVTM